MATLKKRLNISLSPEIEEVIIKLANRDNIPQATKAAELLRIGLELEEDITLDKIAADRYKTLSKTLPHKDFWK